MRRGATDLDLRIKAGAALTCDLSTRVAAASAREPEPADAFADVAISDAEHPRLRIVAYLCFALAIALPWVLFLTDQVLP